MTAARSPCCGERVMHAVLPHPFHNHWRSCAWRGQCSSVQALPPVGGSCPLRSFPLPTARACCTSSECCESRGGGLSRPVSASSCARILCVCGTFVLVVWWIQCTWPCDTKAAAPFCLYVCERESERALFFSVDALFNLSCALFRGEDWATAQLCYQGDSLNVCPQDMRSRNPLTCMYAPWATFLYFIINGETFVTILPVWVYAFVAPRRGSSAVKALDCCSRKTRFRPRLRL